MSDGEGMPTEADWLEGRYRDAQLDLRPISGGLSERLELRIWQVIRPAIADDVDPGQLRVNLIEAIESQLDVSADQPNTGERYEQVGWAGYGIPFHDLDTACDHEVMGQRVCEPVYRRLDVSAVSGDPNAYPEAEVDLLRSEVARLEAEVERLRANYNKAVEGERLRDTMIERLRAAIGELISTRGVDPPLPTVWERKLREVLGDG